MVAALMNGAVSMSSMYIFALSLSHHSSKMYYLLLTMDRTLLPGVDSLDQTAALGLLSAWVLQVQKY